MRGFIGIAIMGLSMLLIASCKQEGCTNPDALNYNVVADEDDGSCEFCNDDGPQDIANTTYTLYDNRSWSIYFNQPIAEIEIYQRELLVDYVDCGQSSCYFDLEVENITENEISLFQFSLNIPNTGSFTYGISQWQSVSIPEGESIVLTNFIVSFPPQVCFPMTSSNEIFGQVNSAEFN